MDRIGEAISKARAARGGGAAPHTPAAGTVVDAPRAPATVSSPAPSEAVSDRWAALPQCEIMRHSLQRALVVAMDGGSASAPFDMLRTKVLQQVKAQGWRRIGVTSPNNASGKSTVALNLAFSLARNPEVRTVLVDADLRRPAVARMLDIVPQASFFSVLAGRARFEDCALGYGENLCLATNARAHRSPSELMQMSNAAQELAQIEADYQPDVMLFDLAPVLQTDDALVMMQHLDAAIIVAAAEVTSIHEVDLCEAEVAARTNVMGVVLNKTRFTGKIYGYGYST